MNRLMKVVLTGALALSPVIGVTGVSAAPVTNEVSATKASTLSVAAKRDKVVKTALSLQNKVQYVPWTQRQESHAPYKTDCSGFTALVYKLANVGVTLVDRDDDHQAKVGTKITSYKNLQKGDLIFFGNLGSSKSLKDVGHVGIYIGNGKMIHNLNSKNDVKISDINSSYYKSRFIVARRVIK
ncbi:C40 family peptidase [Paenibacillus sp. UNC451MF]|uniref:C40 family peptidase n=1 Tax=Paenibacillus sp. UNC451MF TaxID=1449063 RepID=UPI00068DDE07|nr:C40 family peptidase [Paenibacillus sp. UNC451MF]